MTGKVGPAGLTRREADRLSYEVRERAESDPEIALALAEWTNPRLEQQAHRFRTGQATRSDRRVIYTVLGEIAKLDDDEFDEESRALFESLGIDQW